MEIENCLSLHASYLRVQTHFVGKMQGHAVTWLLTAGMLLSLFSFAAQAREQLIGPETVWQYYDAPSLPPADWAKPGFDAKSWKTGKAPFGAEIPGIETPVGAGQAQVSAAFFRTTLSITNGEGWAGFEFWVRASDGFLIFYNGKPHGGKAVEKLDLAAPGRVAFHPADGYRLVQIPIAGGNHSQGEVTIAVAVLKSPYVTERIGFDMQMYAYEAGREQSTVVPFKSNWAYQTGSVPSSSWKLPDFDDSNWKTGPALLGYGDPDVDTTVSIEGDGEDKPITTWFRKEFQLSKKGKTPESAALGILCDDGAVIYVNGIEIGRDNMPEGAIDSSTLAIDSQNNGWERFVKTFPVSSELLRPGRNVIAVEVHQNKASSSDLAFDMQFMMQSLPGDWDWDEATAPQPEADESDQPRSQIVNVNNPAAIRTANTSSWRATSTAMIVSAIKAYEQSQLEPSARRYAASRWAIEFAGDARGLAPELKQYLLSTEATALSLEYFDLLSPRDKTRKVYAILNALFTESPETFKEFAGLAFAISIVYDQKPPGNWPHFQVSQSLLPRKLPDPVDAFNFWVSADKRGKTLHSLDKLQLEELKYVVDVPVSIETLEEALSERARLSGMSDLYSGIRYDHQRFQTGVYNWPHSSYSLDEIKKLGGICVDQAYFTTIVAKAHGVPSMLVSGAGQDGNHAWVGFLDKKIWDFETGRYPESKFVTGKMFDPQTWEQPTDHEIAFLSERFRGSSKYRNSRIHARFAAEFFNSKAIAKAEKAARAAIESESRNLDAWTILLECLAARNAPLAERDQTLEDAAKAFSRYADMESQFLEKLATSYASQGRTKEADKLRSRIIRRNSEDRPDLALAQAKSELDELIKTKPIKDQVAHYKRVISRLDEAGLIAYYALTQPFLSHLQRKGDGETARDVLKYTRRRLKSSSEGQLGEALDTWETRLGG